MTPTTDTPRGTMRAAAGWLFYSGLALLLTLILTQQLDSLLPTELATRIGYNSEGYALALVLAAWIQFGLPRLVGRGGWLRTLLLTVGTLALAVYLVNSDLPSRFTTLNEAFFALALLVPYVALPRPLRRWPAPLSVALLLGVVLAVQFGPPESPVILLAETMAVFILAPLAFDVVDRGILDDRAVTSTAVRAAWYGALIAIPLVVVALGTDARTGGGVHAVLEYIGRVHEAVIGLLLVQLYFAVVLRRTGTRALARQQR